MSRFYVTTPIYYLNGRPHIGHAYTTIAADVIARWHRMKGDQVRFLTGTDEHGQKVFKTAQKRGITPKQHVDELVGPFKDLWTRLDVQYDDFIRTTEPRHIQVVQDVLQMLYDRGEIYEDFYEGWYSTAAERFWTEKDLIDGKCPDTGQPVEWITEKNYFFRMSRYGDLLRKWIEDHPDFIRPVSRKNEVLGYLRQEMGDLCITRPKERLPWGIEIPFDRDYVTYVWFDALLNYITALGYHPARDNSELFEHFWPASYQLVGKDILTTHAVYWSTMLFALGLTPSQCLYAHGWWTVKQTKMSKSLGNVIDPNLLLDAYGVDAVRFFVLKEIPFGGDGDFSHDAFMKGVNSYLANDFGNLAHRALSMTNKWLGGQIPPLDEPTERDDALTAMIERVLPEYIEQLEALQFSIALETLWTFIRAGNKYLDDEAPWALNREGKTERLQGVMRRAMEICRIASVLVSPFLTRKSLEMLNNLGLDEIRFEKLTTFDGLTAGADVSDFDPLFPRIQELPPAIQAVLGADAPEAPPKPKKNKTSKKKKDAEPRGDGLITFDDFQKVQLRAGRVVAAKPHPNADKLLVLQVDLGEGQPRQIVAGIASRYPPETLVGQMVVAVANLKPARLRGEISQGMLLAAGAREVQGLVTLSDDVEPGTVVR
ncbi:MAG: methionine--tRNA ligase [Myxococcota bacterium]